MQYHLLSFKDLPSLLSPTEKPTASSGPLIAIRLRISSDYSAGNDSVIGGVEEDDAASLKQPFIPFARITEYDEDADVLDALASDAEEYFLTENNSNGIIENEGGSSGSDSGEVDEAGLLSTGIDASCNGITDPIASQNASNIFSVKDRSGFSQIMKTCAATPASDGNKTPNSNDERGARLPSSQILPLVESGSRPFTLQNQASKCHRQPMELPAVSSVFSFAIRAPLTAEDSSSDFSDNSIEDDDDAASPRRPFIPVARITEDDEGSFEELVFDDDEEEVVKTILMVDNLVAAGSNAGADEDFGGLFVSGNEENDDDFAVEGPAMVSAEGFAGDVGRMADFLYYAGTGLNDMKTEMIDKNMVNEVEDDLDFNAVICEKTESVGCENVKGSRGPELKSDFEIDLERTNLARNNDATLKSVMEVKLGTEAEAGNFVIPEVKDNVVEIANIEDTGEVTPSQQWNEEAKAKAMEAAFEGHIVSGREEKDNDLDIEDPAIESVEEFGEVGSMSDFIDGAGDKFSNGDLKMDDKNEVHEVEDDLDFNAVVCEKIDGAGFGNMKLIESFELESEAVVIDSERTDIVSVIDSALNSAMEVKLRSNAQADSLANLEGEGYLAEILKIESSFGVDSSRQWSEVAEAKAMETEFGFREVIKEEAAKAFDLKNDIFGEKNPVFEADYAESKVFESINFDGVRHGQVLEMKNLPDNNKSFEPRHSEVCADDMEANDFHGNVNSMVSEIEKYSTGKLLFLNGIEDDHSQYFDNFYEKYDEYKFVIRNYSAFEFFPDNFSSFFASKIEMESMFASSHAADNEDSVKEEGAAIMEYLTPVKLVQKEMDDGSSRYSQSGFETSPSYSCILDGQSFSNSDREGEINEDDNQKEMNDISAMAHLLRTGTLYSACGCSSSASLHSAQFLASDRYEKDMTDEEKNSHFKIEQMRVKYLRLIMRLGHFADDALPDRVLRWLGLADLAIRGSKVDDEFILENAKKVALQLEDGQEDLNFSCNILLLGKTGVGKSAIINSIFGEKRASTDPFHPTTTSIREVCGLVDGVHLRAVDTPGMLPALNNQRANMKILSSIKKYIRRCPPDVVLYVDRMDEYNQDFDDMPMLQTITRILGSSIWFNAIITLTNAGADFPDELDGSPLSYDEAVARRSRVVQQSIRRAVKDSHLVNSVALVENHSSCMKNQDGEKILPNGLRWRSWLLLLCYSSKILSEIDSLMKIDVLHKRSSLFSVIFQAFFHHF